MRQFERCMTETKTFETPKKIKRNKTTCHTAEQISWFIFIDHNRIPLYKSNIQNSTKLLARKVTTTEKPTARSPIAIASSIWNRKY